MPGLTIVTLVCLAILVSLGTWQWRRLQWKTALLSEIDKAAHSQPVKSLDELQRLINDKQPLEFRRVSLNGEFITPSINAGQPFYVMRSNGQTMDWHIYRLFRQGDLAIYIDTQSFSDAQKSNPPQVQAGPAQIFGYVRVVRKPNRFMPKSDPNHNKWYGVNAVPDLLDWFTGSSIPMIMEVTIDRVDIPDEDMLEARVPDIRNNHFDYMLTWYSFAIILLVIYVLLHLRQGRLSLKS